MPLPSEEELRQARGQAVDAKLAADALKARWARAQRNADSLMHHYEQMLAMYQGQLDFDFEEQP